MNSLRRLLAALGATATAATIAVLMPAYAWAADHPTIVAAGTEVARRRRGYGRGLGCGGFCCLLFIVLIVVVVLLVRRRRGPRQP